MGVQGLWKLVEPCGRMVPLEGMTNKVLAVDVSIWLHQAMKGMHDTQGAPIAVAHLLVLFHRLCKLLFYKIKPVFVFDGGVPALKRQTMATRRMKKSTARSEASRVRGKLLKNLLKHEAIRHVMSDETATAALGLTSLTLPGPSEEEDLYKLPPVATQASASNTSASSGSESDNDEEYEGKYLDIHSLDVNSTSFKALPAEVRHDILSDIKDTRKQSSWRHLDKMPQQSQDFSDFQMNRLLKRRAVQVSLEECGKEMGARDVSLQELQGLLGDGFSSGSVLSGRVAQTDTTHYMLIQKPQNLVQKPNVEVGNKDLVAASQGFDISEHLEDVVWSSDSEGESTLMNASEEKIDGDLKPNQLALSQILTSASEKIVDEIESVLQEGIAVKKTVVMGAPKEGKINEAKDATDEIELILQEGIKEKKIEETVVIDVPKKENISEAKDSTILEEVIEVKNVKEISKSNLIKMELEEETNLNSISAKDEKVSAILSILEDSDQKTEEIIDVSSKLIKEEIDLELLEETPNSSGNNEKYSQKTLASSGYSSQMSIPLDEGEELINNDGTQKQESRIEPETISSDLEISSSKNQVEFKSADKATIDYLEDVNQMPPMVDERKSEVTSGEAKNKESSDSDEDFVVVEDLPPSYPEKSNEPMDIEKSPEFQPGLSESDMKDMRKNLENEMDSLLSEKGRQERLAQNVTDQMCAEAQELLQLFGVPYIVAPMEAEAQCAALDLLGLTEGTITDDSDIWLFGGRIAYKNFFNQKKHVLEYRADDITQYFKLTREEMVRLALLVGSDYTPGLPGIGPVTALEVLAAFPCPKNSQNSDQLLSGLQKFQEWVASGFIVGPTRATLKNKVKNTSLLPGFPSRAVVEAYLLPEVDNSKEQFSWAKPNLQLLEKYAKLKFGWSTERCNELLMPVMKKLLQTTDQTTINRFFRVLPPPTLLEGRLSKRVEGAVKRLGRPIEPENSDSEDEEKPSTSRPKKAKISKTIAKKESASLDALTERLHKDIVIPQREKDRLLREQLKKKAAELLKSTRGRGRGRSRGGSAVQASSSQSHINLSESSDSS